VEGADFGYYASLLTAFLDISSINIVSLGGHVGWKPVSPRTILEGGHPRTVPPKFGLNWLSGF
jgi:hypothetical protein